MVYQLITKKMLEEHSKFVGEVIQFYDGQPAAEYFSKYENSPAQLPDVIFLDVRMPQMDGWQFLESLEDLELDKKVVIHMVSSSISPEDTEKARQNKLVKDYIVKPVSKDELNIALEMALDEF